MVALPAVTAPLRSNIRVPTPAFDPAAHWMSPTLSTRAFADWHARCRPCAQRSSM